VNLQVDFGRDIGFSVVTGSAHTFHKVTGIFRTRDEGARVKTQKVIHLE